MLAMGIVEEGATRVAGFVGFGFFGLHLVAAGRMFLVPRRRRDLFSDEVGSLTIRSPRLFVWPVVLAWGALPIFGAAFGAQLLVDRDSVEVPVATLLAVAASIVLLPEWFRLVTGRRHRWRVVLSDEGLLYQGYMTKTYLPWSKVHGSSVSRVKPFGAAIDIKGNRPDLVLQEVLFDVPAEQLVEEIEKRLRAAGRPVSWEQI